MQGWPDDPENPELLRLAEQLLADRPTLSAEALARIEQTLVQALAGRQVRRRRTLVGIVLGLAAALLIGAGAYLLFRPTPPPVEPLPVVKQQPPDRVQDRYPIALPAPSETSGPERSLVRLEPHRSLFTD
jgi:hypothetical protein